MNKEHLLLTSTAKMNRAQWLEFRQPLIHIKDFLDKCLRFDINPNIPREAFWNMDMKESIYPMLKDFFAGRTFKENEWKEFIFPCVGASEVADVMGLNPYKSIIELYFEKVGAKAAWDGMNAAMFWGKELEEPIAEKWQYWDGNVEGMIENFTNGNIIRKCRRINFYVRNKQFPWLFASLDRVINKQYSGTEVTKEGSLECKTISGWASEMWEGGIPVMYVAQLQAQLVACGLDFGEIAILKDGRNFDVFPFDAHPEIANRIIEMTKTFTQLVKAGASEYLLHLYAPTTELRDEHYAKMENLAPEPDGSDSYKKYLTEKYNQPVKGSILGTIVEEQLAMNYKFYGNKISELESKQLECSNKLKAFMKEVTKLDLGKTGSCTWTENGKGTRTFRVNVKIADDYVPDTYVTPAPKSLEAKVAEHNNTQQEFQNDKTPRKRSGSKKKTEGE